MTVLLVAIAILGFSGLATILFTNRPRVGTVSAPAHAWALLGRWGMP